MLEDSSCSIVLGFLCHIYFTSTCIKCFQIVKGLDCRQGSSEPKHLYYRATLLYKMQFTNI